MSKTANEATPQIVLCGPDVILPFSVRMCGETISGTVCPATMTEAFIAENAPIDPADPKRPLAELIAKHVKTWNCPEPVTTENVLRLTPGNFAALRGVLLFGDGCEAAKPTA